MNLFYRIYSSDKEKRKYFFQFEIYTVEDESPNDLLISYNFRDTVGYFNIYENVKKEKFIFLIFENRKQFFNSKSKISGNRTQERVE